MLFGNIKKVCRTFSNTIYVKGKICFHNILKKDDDYEDIDNGRRKNEDT